jgi:hypothetical protein
VTPEEFDEEMAFDPPIPDEDEDYWAQYDAYGPEYDDWIAYTDPH